MNTKITYYSDESSDKPHHLSNRVRDEYDSKYLNLQGDRYVVDQNYTNLAYILLKAILRISSIASVDSALYLAIIFCSSSIFN